MEKTIADAALKVLQTAQKPMTAAEIAQAILDGNLYEFRTKDCRGVVRQALDRRSEGHQHKGKPSVAPKLFEKLADGTYRVKGEVNRKN